MESISLNGASHNDFIYLYCLSLVARAAELCVILSVHITTQDVSGRQQAGSATSSFPGSFWSLGGMNIALEPRHNYIWILASSLCSHVTMGNLVWFSGSVSLAIEMKILVLPGGAVRRSRWNRSCEAHSPEPDIWTINVSARLLSCALECIIYPYGGFNNQLLGCDP